MAQNSITDGNRLLFEKTSGIICYFIQSDRDFVKTSADFFLLSKTFHIFAKKIDETYELSKEGLFRKENNRL